LIGLLVLLLIYKRIIVKVFPSECKVRKILYLTVQSLVETKRRLNSEEMIIKIHLSELLHVELYTKNVPEKAIQGNFAVLSKELLNERFCLGEFSELTIKLDDMTLVTSRSG